MPLPTLPIGKILSHIPGITNNGREDVPIARANEVVFSSRESLPIRVGGAAASMLGMSPREDERMGEYWMRVWGDVLRDETRRKLAEMMSKRNGAQ